MERYIPLTPLSESDVKKFINLYEVKEHTRNVLLSIQPHNLKDEKYMWCICEAAINIEGYINNIKKTFKDIKGEFINKFRSQNLTDLYEFFNDVFKNNKIKFISSGGGDTKYIANAGTEKTSLDIYVYCNFNVIEIIQNSKNYDAFIKESLTLIGHELIHREQMLHVNDIKLRKHLFKFFQLSKDDINIDRQYLSKKYEIMSFAWQIVETFRMTGAKDRGIQEVLQDSSQKKFAFSPILLWYHEIFTIEDEPLKRLYKNMFEYLNL